MSGSNIVPMPNMMPAMWSGNPIPAGCCPPGGMDALMKCYCDIQAATAFISKVVQDLAANDPAFQKSLVDAIVASGSNIPLIGVTNGTAAQPGQVGEVVHLTGAANYTNGGQILNQSVTLGVLQPGDWDCWLWAVFSTSITGASFYLSPLPAGFTDSAAAAMYVGTGAEGMILNSFAVQGLISVPSLIVALVTVNPVAGATGFMGIEFLARRRR